MLYIHSAPVLLLLSFALAAQNSCEQAPELLAPFACLDLPDCAGMTLVEFNTGGWCRGGGNFECQYVVGWLLAQDATQVELWDSRLKVGRYSRKVVFPHDWARLTKAHAAGRPLPTEFRPVDFQALCRAAHEDAGSDARGLQEEGFRAAVLALWAHQRSERKLRDDLLRTMRSRYEEASPIPVVEQLRVNLAEKARWHALAEAMEGRPRAQLLAAWKGIARLAPEASYGEAIPMIAAYESLLAQDAQFHDPRDTELAKLPAAAQTDVWLHRLRDVAASQWIQLCGCDGPDYLRDGPTRAADALCALGWVAVPGLIARLDDGRPTRSVGRHGLSLITHADWSRSILSTITGEPFATRAEAEAWWRAHGETDPEKFYLAQLARGVNQHFTAEQLLSRDAPAYLPMVAEAIQRGDAAQRRAIGYVFARHARMEHIRLLESLLALEDHYICSGVAEALARLGAPARGVERLVELIEAAAVSPRDDPFLNWADRAVRFLTAHDQSRAVRAVLALVKRKLLERSPMGVRGGRPCSCRRSARRFGRAPRR